jgi:hypothetical protein
MATTVLDGTVPQDEANQLAIRDLFHKALSSECGLAITFTSHYLAQHFRRKLYTEREKLRVTGIDAYDGMSFLVRNRTEVWIIRRETLTPPPSVGFQDCRPLTYAELPSRILSRGKSRPGICIS